MDRIHFRDSIQPWISRVLIGVVLFFNVQCAVVFLLWPGAFSGSFELSGIPGRAMVQGMGILFLMWNIPYVMAMIHPVKRLTSLVEAFLMQAIGLTGESILLISLPEGYQTLRMTALRFIGFDGGGLVLLAAGLWLSLSYKKNHL